MEIIIEGKQAYMAYSKSLEKKGIGSKKAGRLELNPIEVIYLALKNRVKVRMKIRTINIIDLFNWATSSNENCLYYYHVYEDLRSRGYKVRPVDKYLVGKYVFLPIAESKKVTIKEIAEQNVEKLILAVVDEENEVTYYKVEEVDLRGNQIEHIEKVKGYFIKDKVITTDTELFNKFFYGSYKDGIVTLSIIEALYLMELGVLDVYEHNKRLNEDDLKKIGENLDPNFDRRYEVYKDLKNRGFVVKTGFKFGSDFRVYDIVRDVNDLPHSKYLVTIVDDKRLYMYEIARAVRLAQSVKKKMIFVYKNNGENKYILIERIKV